MIRIITVARCSSGGSEERGDHYPKPDIVVPVAVSAAHVLWIIVECAATQHPGFSGTPLQRQLESCELLLIWLAVLALHLRQ